MKKQIAALALVVSVFAAANAFAYPGARPYYRGGYYTYYWWGWCAPEVQESNVAAVDRVVNEIAQRTEFAGAAQFRDALKSIQAIQATDAKIAAYMNTLAIDTQNQEALVEFAYAREIKVEQVQALQASMGLSAEQAKIVAGSVAQALRGGMQK
ncbi:hypothetical protein K2X30_14405 [bacterium]|jgi:hypothetical protein|nr:hypothetical protein [bacterium]